MPRGGKRTGTPGVAHAQRTDLNGPQPVKTAPGQAYGAAQQQREAQNVIPISGTQVAPAQPPGAPAAAGPPSLPVQPGSLGWTDPSARPDEPVTAGLPMGAGGGPEMLGGALSGNDDVEMQLRAIYQAHPTEQLRALIEAIDNGDT